MAYQTRGLSVLAYANGFTLWHYKSADAIEAIAGQGYFAAAADFLTSGDVVVIRGGDGQALRAVSFRGGVLTLEPLI